MGAVPVCRRFRCGLCRAAGPPAPPETGALARAASGALDIVPVVREVDISRAIASLQKAGFWVMGLTGDASRTLAEARPVIAAWLWC
jgi:tRNA G18 (ribose-2'-O)-methylase SpoU